MGMASVLLMLSPDITATMASARLNPMGMATMASALLMRSPDMAATMASARLSPMGTVATTMGSVLLMLSPDMDIMANARLSLVTATTAMASVLLSPTEATMARLLPC